MFHGEHAAIRREQIHHACRQLGRVGDRRQRDRRRARRRLGHRCRLADLASAASCRCGGSAVSAISGRIRMNVSTISGSYMVPRRSRDSDRGVAIERAAVRPIRGERVVAVDHGQDSRADRYLLPRTPRDNRSRSSSHGGSGLSARPDRESRSPKDVCADVHVAFHLVEFGRGQPARLVQDVFRHGKLAGVVQQRRGLDCLDPRSSRTPSARASATERLHAADVSWVTPSFASIAVASVSTVER